MDQEAQRDQVHEIFQSVRSDLLHDPRELCRLPTLLGDNFDRAKRKLDQLPRQLLQSTDYSTALYDLEVFDSE